MIGFILLRGKDFAIPDGVSTGIIGLFFGLVCGLFFYQRYYRSYYWFISLIGGLSLTYLFNALLLSGVSADEARALRLTIASFVIPFALTLALNYGLSRVKRRKRTKHNKRKMHSDFFNGVNGNEILKTEPQFTRK